VTRWPSAGGGGANWSPGLLDRAETFAEGDVTLTNQNTKVESESVGLVSGGSYAPLDNPAGAGGPTVTDAGVTFTPKQTPTHFAVTIAAGYGSGDEVRVERLSDGTIVDSATHSGGGSFVSLDHTALEVGEEYAVYDHGSTSYTSFDASNDVPITSAGVDIEAGWLDGASQSDGTYQLDRLEMDTEVHQGSTIVEWPTPADLAGWDIIPYEATEDGGTIEVYAVDPSDGTRLAGPLDDPGDISSLPRSTNVAVEVVLERPSTSENPRLDAVYRRRKIT